LVFEGYAVGSYRKGIGILKISEYRRVASLPIVVIRVGATPNVHTIAFTG
jgi:hypothetical protein